MKYNLIRNSYFDSLSVSGTGSIDLNWTQLESLMDGVTISGGVNLTPGDVLWLSVDMSQRIKLDSIRLYTNDLSKSTNISFYCKDSETDSYTLLVTNSGTDYYYPTLIDPKAPQFILTTISGVSMGIYEFMAVNNDYIVAFGEDGQMYAKHLDNAPIGEEGEPHAVAIYNKADSGWPATGYTTIDYTGTDADNYVKISASENGTYKGLSDGVMLEDNNLASTYIWDMGEYDNIAVENNKLTLESTGTYPTDHDKICDLPLLDGSESLNVGSSAMAYDPTNEVIYVLGTEPTPTILKLYKYDIPTNDWTYLWEVNPGVTGFEETAGICYLDGYVYIMCNWNYVFGRYNVVTMSGVWEPLATPTGMPTEVSRTATSIAADGNNLVYVAALYGNVPAFQRYNTISGTWAVLDNGFGYSYAHYNYACAVNISYDTDRDYVYSIAGNYTTNYGYVSRYDVSTDTWNKDYLNRSTLGGSPISSAIDYYEDYIFLYSYGSTPTAYLYHIPSDSPRSIYVGNPTIHPKYGGGSYVDHKTFMCAINPLKSNDTMSIMFGCVNNYMDELYGYNMTPLYDASGNYISPIFKMGDRYSSSYFVVDATTTSGLTSVSYDEGSYNGTIRVRSSNTEPLAIEEIYLPYGRDARKMVPYNGSDVRWLDDYAEADTDAIMGAVDRRTGNVFFLTQRYSRLVHLYKINRSGDTLYCKSHWNDNKYMCDYQLEFDYIGGIWGYGKYHIYQSSSHRLVHLDTTLATDLAIIHENGIDFLHDFAAEMNGDGVWYTNKSVNVVYHLDTDGNTLQQIVLQTPCAICGTSDNGCWVMDNVDFKVYRYDFNGNLVKTITLSRYADRMTSDLLDGFWYMRDNTIYHVTSAGVEDTSTMVSQPTIIRSMHTGCVVWSRTTNIVTCIDFNGNITRTFSRSSNAYGFGVYSHNYTDHLNYHTDILPISYDPIWGITGSAIWKEVRKDGYFLPKEQYHQVELTLRTTDVSYTPYVNKLLMAPSIKIEDIPSKNYKNIYIKTDIPSGADITDHESKLKVWWKIEE